MLAVSGLVITRLVSKLFLFVAVVLGSAPVPDLQGFDSSLEIFDELLVVFALL